MSRDPRRLFLVLVLSQAFSPFSPAVHPSGSAEIDRARQAIAPAPTTVDSVERRSLLLFTWMRTLQQQGAANRRLYCLDVATGKPHWIHKLGHRTEEATLCIYPNLLYVLSADGYLHAIE